MCVGLKLNFMTARFQLAALLLHLRISAGPEEKRLRFFYHVLLGYKVTSKKVVRLSGLSAS
jgi:hypothetical protein